MVEVVEMPTDVPEKAEVPLAAEKPSVSVEPNWFSVGLLGLDKDSDAQS